MIQEKALLNVSKISEKLCENCLCNSTLYLLDNLRKYFKTFSPKEMFYTSWLGRVCINIVSVFRLHQHPFAWVCPPVAQDKHSKDGEQAPEWVLIMAATVTDPWQTPRCFFNQGGFLHLVLGYYCRGIPTTALFSSLSFHHDFALIFTL